MPFIEHHRQALRGLAPSEWEPYLLAHSNLPGPRGNLELAQAAAEEGTEAQFRRWAALGPDVAPENTPQCFLAFCGVVGLGASLRGAVFATKQSPAHGGDCFANTARNDSPLQTLRALAADPRWRIREAVAMALQRWGDADMAGLLAEIAVWATGNPWEQRAAAAALCEPRLLKNPEHAAAVLSILDQITTTITTPARSETGQSGAARSETGQSGAAQSETGQSGAARSETGQSGAARSETGQSRETGLSGRDAFKTLRQGLAYCWSVAVVALPDAGKPLMEKWLASPDPDIRWIMRENLKKNRLVKMDAGWVARWLGN